MYIHILLITHIYNIYLSKLHICTYYVYMYIHIFMYTYTQSLAAAEHQDFSNSNMRIYIHGWSLHCAVLKSAAGGGGWQGIIGTMRCCLLDIYKRKQNMVPTVIEQDDFDNFF